MSHSKSIWTWWGSTSPMHAVFIRAPRVAKAGGGVEVLAAVEEYPVMVRQANILAVSFHPELTGDHRIHTMVVQAAEHWGDNGER